MELRKIPHPEGPRSGRLEGRTGAPPTDSQTGTPSVLSGALPGRTEPGAQRDQARKLLFVVIVSDGERVRTPRKFAIMAC
jgi:hypothetical protein